MDKESSEVLLSKADLMARLRISSETAWVRRRRDLIKRGLIKDGKSWLMKSSDFDQYIEQKKLVPASK